MDKTKFAHYAESYGSDLQLWPIDVKAEAQLALENHPEWMQVLEQEQDLDHLLSQYQLPKVDFSALEQSVISETTHKTSFLDWIIGWLQPEQSIWRPALAACLPILIGITLGTNLELNEQYVLSEEIEILDGSMGDGSIGDSSIWDNTLFDEIDFEGNNNEA